MPTFGIPDPLLAGNIFSNQWDFWQQFPKRIAEDKTPSRVIWVANSVCEERYQIAPAYIENPET